jgi:hypothetical protein
MSEQQASRLLDRPQMRGRQTALVQDYLARTAAN